jgi:ubiquinone/menaquinone biosynthesis C-methylase UbiE
LESRFNDIASVYDAQIPQHVRLHLLTRKTAFMTAWLKDLDRSTAVGLDLGCGTGWHVQRLQELGYRVWGLDSSVAQLREATHRQTACFGSCWCLSDVQKLPYPDAGIDFAYAINVVHHLETRAEQMAAIQEIGRVLKPGGLFFLHEVSTTNPVMAVYMNYVFPRLRRIDNGQEHWILPEDLKSWPGFELLDVQRFTFVPDFTPRWLFPVMARLEGWLEGTPLRAFAAHYMGVLRRKR